MNQSIQQILRKIAPTLAEKDAELIPALSGQSAAGRPGGEDAWFREWITSTVFLFADALASTQAAAVAEKGKALAERAAVRGVPPSEGVAGICRLRRLLLDEIDALISQAQRPDVRKLLGDDKARLNEYIDVLIETYVRVAVEQANRKQEIRPKLRLDSRLVDVAEHELFRLILESSDIALFVIDTDLCIREVNQAFLRMCDREREALIGRPIDEAYPSESDRRFIRRVIERGESGHHVTEIHGKWVTLSISPIRHEDKLWGAIAMVRDITENKKLELEMSRREALAAVGQLAAGMAHEIRNPLTSIKGFIQLLSEEIQTEKSDSYISVIMAEIERIDGLLNDVLVLARYRDDQVTLERFPLMEELVGVVRLLEPEANRRGISVELSPAEWQKTWVHGHRARLKQVFLNLLKNSLEAVSGKGAKVAVQVLTTVEQVIVIVEDDGPGLSPEVRQNLFVPFFTTKPDGTGLGLSTTQRIVEDHGGEIFADNSPTLGGARFEVRLPLSPP